MQKNKPIPVLIVLPTLTAGGAERVMSFIYQKLDSTKFTTHLVVLGHTKMGYDIDRSRITFLNKQRVLFAIPALFSFLKKSNAKIVLSSIWHVNMLMGVLSLFFSNKKFVGREVSIMSVLKDFPEKKSKSFPKLLSKLAYSRLDAVICQSADMKNDFLDRFPQFEYKLIVINNPITDGFVPKKEKSPYTTKLKLITVASLEPRKGHNRILKAIANLNIAFEYTIIGSGSQYETLFKMAEKLQIHKNVRFVPFTKKVADYLKEHHIFLQGSYVEGFPNALLESCAVGTPVIAFKAPGGIDEIIQNDINGFTVENETEFNNAIHKIINSENFRPETVSKSVFDKYAASEIVKKYELLFLDLVT